MSSSCPEDPMPPLLSRRQFVCGTSGALLLLGTGLQLGAAEGERDLAAWQAFLRQPWEKPATKLAETAGSHPRLFLNQNSLTGLKRRANSTHASIWAMIREKA